MYTLVGVCFNRYMGSLETNSGDTWGGSDRGQPVGGKMCFFSLEELENDMIVQNLYYLI